MKKTILLVISGGLLLSGCATPEVRTEQEPKDGLTSYSDSDAKQPSESSPQTKTAPVRQAPPAAAPNDNKLTDKKMYTTPPQMTIDTEKTYTATLKTSAGDIIVSLNAKETPVTANNFIFLAREKFYDGTIFHRAIKGFMIQGGDPEGTGMGGPGYRFDDEPFEGEYARGTLAMANAGPDTNGSQFFIMHQDSPLPPNYVIFGKVISGMEAVDKIAEAPVTRGAGGENSSPVAPVTIQAIEIAEK